MRDPTITTLEQRIQKKIFDNNEIVAKYKPSAILAVVDMMPGYGDLAETYKNLAPVSDEESGIKFAMDHHIPVVKYNREKKCFETRE